MNGDSADTIATLNIDRESYSQFSRVYRGNNTDLNVTGEDPASTDTFVNGQLFDKVYHDADGEVDEFLSTKRDIAFAGGSGTAEDPLLIANATQFSYLANPEVIATGVKDFKLSEDLTLSEIPSFDGREETNIDLADNTLNINSRASGDDSITITSGTVKLFSSSENKGVLVCDTSSNIVQTAFEITSGASLIVDNLDITTTSLFAYPRGDAAKVEVLNSNISAQSYGISTNAGKVDNYNVQINVENSTISSALGAGIMINVPGTLNVKNSEIYGLSQAIFVRAGNVNVEDTLLKINNERELGAEAYLNKAWGNGNAAPKGFIVIGDRWDREKSSYLSSNIVANLTSVSFKAVDATDAEKYDYPFVYAYYTGNTEKPTITLDSNTIDNIGGLEENPRFSQYNVDIKTK